MRFKTIKFIMLGMALLLHMMIVPLFSASESMRIAVIDFKANDVSRFSAKAVSEFIGIEMAKKKEIMIVERSQIGVVLDEQGLQQTGCTDQTCAVQLGKLLSARKIIVGTLNKTGRIYVITAKVIDVETGRVDNAETERCTKEDDFAMASKIIAVKITNKITGTDYAIPLRTYRQDVERNRFSIGLMYQLGVYPEYKMPGEVYDASDGVYKLQGQGKDILVHNLVISMGYEFLRNFELKAEFGYMLGWNSTEGECDIGGSTMMIDVDDRRTERFEISIFPMYKYPLSGFNLFIAPGIGYRFQRQKEDYSLSYGTTGEYLLNPVGHALLLKCEAGATVFVSRFVELVFAVGVDAQVYSNIYNNVTIKTVSGSASDLDGVVNDAGNTAFVGCYIKTGVIIRAF